MQINGKAGSAVEQCCAGKLGFTGYADLKVSKEVNWKCAWKSSPGLLGVLRTQEKSQWRRYKGRERLLQSRGFSLANLGGEKGREVEGQTLGPRRLTPHLLL